MHRTILFLIIIISSLLLIRAVNDYNSARARQYVKEVEYYKKKADGYRREAYYFLKKGEAYHHESAYYTRKGDADRAKNYTRRANNAMDDYKAQMNYAANADDKAAGLLKIVAILLQKKDSTMTYLWICIITYILYSNRERLLAFFRRIFRRGRHI